MKKGALPPDWRIPQLKLVHTLDIGSGQDRNSPAKIAAINNAQLTPTSLLRENSQFCVSSDSTGSSYQTLPGYNGPARTSHLDGFSSHLEEGALHLRHSTIDEDINITDAPHISSLSSAMTLVSLSSFNPCWCKTPEYHHYSHHLLRSSSSSQDTEWTLLLFAAPSTHTIWEKSALKRGRKAPQDRWRRLS